ncbi:MAG TPA: DUF488 domain-containing protein [Oculatellaceae cyanobacterium]
MKAEKMTVFTIGHSTHSLDEFVEMLRANGVEKLIDIRSLPGSTKFTHFDRESLSKSLRNRKIGYKLLKKLGGRRRVNKDNTSNLGWRNAAFRGYADYMQTEGFAEGLAQLIEIASEKRVAIMCAEAVPWRCHRSLVADALITRGINVRDIFSKTSTKPHELNAMARVSKGQLSYPEEKQAS